MKYFYRLERWVKDKAFYDILGVSTDCSREHIKKAFIRLALQYHPDKNPNGCDQFIQIAKSYKVLSSLQLRHLYDLEGQDILEHGYIPQTDLNTRDKILVILSLTGFVLKNGCKLEFEFEHELECTKCTVGHSKYSIMGSCDFCSGKGKVLYSQVPFEDTEPIKYQYYSCKNCTGVHQPIIECMECNGNGVVKKKYVVPIILKKGLPNGYQFSIVPNVQLPIVANQFIIQLEEVEETFLQ